MSDILPVADFIAVPLEGEPPTDKAFESAGVIYRVRLAVVDMSTVVIPTTASGIAPLRRDIDISVTELGDDGLPIRDSGGNVIIVAQTRWTDDRSLPSAKPPGETLAMLIGHLIHQAKGQAEAALAIDAVLADWGGGVVSSSTPTPPASAPVDPIAALDPSLRPDMTAVTADPDDQ